jgi:hypothetical protein
MVMSFNRILAVRVALTLAALVVGAGCGSPQRPAATVTSAHVPVEEEAEPLMDHHSAVIGRLTHERDVARTRAEEAARIAEAQQERSDKAMRRIVIRDEFQDTVWTQLERLDAKVRTLKARATEAEKIKIRDLARATHEHRTAVERALHKVHSVAIVAWPVFKRDVEQAVAEMERDVEDATPHPKHGR